MTPRPLTVLDVAAHEFGHAITEYTSGLNYSYESGALNESYSDILGAVVEFWAQPDGRSAYPLGRDGQADYLMGEDCWLSDEALRDLRNPQRFGQPSYYLGTNWYSGSGDNGGVHYNSGVQNFAFYLLSEGGTGSNDGHPYNITGLGAPWRREIALYANMYPAHQHLPIPRCPGGLDPGRLHPGLQCPDGPRRLDRLRRARAGEQPGGVALQPGLRQCGRRLRFHPEPHPHQ